MARHYQIPKRKTKTNAETSDNVQIAAETDTHSFTLQIKIDPWLI